MSDDFDPVGDHPFRKLTRAYHERHGETREAQFEESIVKYLLQALQQKPSVRQELLRQHSRDTGGQGRLTLAGFCRRYTSFPLLLGSATLGEVRLHMEPKAMIPALFKNFEAAPFVSAFKLFVEQNRFRLQGRAPGLVFRRKGVRHGLIIYFGLDDLECDGLEWLFHGRRGNEERRFRVLHVRPFQDLAEAVSRVWRPG